MSENKIMTNLFKYIELVRKGDSALLSDDMLAFSLTYIYAMSQKNLSGRLDSAIYDCQLARKNSVFLTELYSRNDTSVYYSEKNTKTELDEFVEAVLEIEMPSFHLMAVAFAFANVNQNLHLELKTSMWKGISKLA